MKFPRMSGILLHPTSLPGPYGIGELGQAAYQFIDFLADAGQKVWQILPLGPTGFGNSPYQSPSAFAGNPLLISLDLLVEEGLLTAEEVGSRPRGALLDTQVNYEAVATFKFPLFRRSYERFRTWRHSPHTSAFKEFCSQHDATWLEDYAMFMALRDQFKCMWNEWSQDIALRKTTAMKKWRSQLADQIELHKYLQYLFFRQWDNLKQHANQRGVQMFGDMPIYVSYDSADVWSNPQLYKLDASGNPTVVAGVPPDYFSATGQRWGNPIYRWDAMAKQDFVWWGERLKHTFLLLDIVRIDHFRGFESYWEVPASEKTAINGTWVKGPGAAFFETMQRSLGDLPIIAEDLGIITDDVIKLRDDFNLPGMKVLHFAFGDTARNPYLPHNHDPNFVVYTGTHDNNTTIGWFDDIGHGERERVQCYLGRDGSDIAWDLIRLALMSVAALSIFPLQDVLRLGSEARMNTPGTSVGNWEWRLRSKTLTPGLASGLRMLTAAYGRCDVPDNA